MIVILMIWAVAAIIAGIVASGKNRSVIGWVLGSVLLSPLIVLILLVLPGESDVGAGPPMADLRKCPFCAEDIQAGAVLCKHCGKDLSAAIEKKTTCPSCNTERVEGTYKCDCGYDYVTRKKTTPLPDSPGGFGV